MSSNSSPSGLTDWQPSPLELRSVIPLRKKTDPHATTAEKITSLSPATIKRKWPEKIKQLSDKREGITLGDALEIAAGIKEEA